MKIQIDSKDFATDGLKSSSADITDTVVNNVMVTVDNGRIYVHVNNKQVYENTSLHCGEVELSF